MINDLVASANETDTQLKEYNKVVDTFLYKTRDIAIKLTNSRSSLYVDGFTVTRKHPWFLSKKRFGDELIIRIKSKVLVSWIADGRGNYTIQPFDEDCIDYLKDFLKKIQALLNIDVLQKDIDILLGVSK